jgi:aromatic-L-amino-acid/L-tryptophan decarboxylase
MTIITMPAAIIDIKMPGMDKNLNLDFSLEETQTMTAELLQQLFEALERPEYIQASGLEGAQEAAKKLAEPELPEKGSDYKMLITQLIDQYFPKSLNTTGPRFFAYIPGGGLIPSSLADFLSTLINRYMGMSYSAPCLAQLESNVLRWFGQIMGYGEHSRGLLTTGGSTANLNALVIAREKLLSNEDPRKGIVYASSHVHHCIEKAMRVAAIPLKNLRKIKVDQFLRMDTEDLEKQIIKDKEKGLIPFFIVGSAGTTNTGAIDPLEKIDTLSKKYHLWFHVDGAYGGFFHMTERGKKALSGIEKANSIAVDPHKTLFMPYGLGALLVKEGRDMINAFSPDHYGDYLPEPESGEDLKVDNQEAWNFHDLSPELSRDFRGIRAWLPIKMYGLERFRLLLNEKLDLTEYAYSQLSTLKGIKVYTKPSLSILTFRYWEKGWNQETANHENRKRWQAILKRNRIHLSPTVIEGDFVIRLCVLNHRTHREHIDEFLEEVKAGIAP